jgi:methylated-DNA-[protein]-cysteine S-methyltransferase
MSDIVFTTFDSPIGALLLAGSGARLARIGFPAGKGRVAPEAHWRRDDAAFAEARGQLAAYFAGRLTRFALELDPQGTAFQRAVWAALAEIPYGVTRSYGALAEAIGRPGSSRAVGAANGANPLPIVLPCHRVIGSNGSLTGFGGGIETKRWLLMHEGVLTRPEPMLI